MRYAIHNLLIPGVSRLPACSQRYEWTLMKSRAEMLEALFPQQVMQGALPEPVVDLTPTEVGLAPTELVDLFESQLMSRHLDNQSRRLGQPLDRPGGDQRGGLGRLPELAHADPVRL
ncbi:hypothetical protein [Sedimenticola hydrogenitrophicus]|uniref:hypothetical protein n=1 Tax=Sedimenticola hydrogenitrophicus TaxID=2967975 RepID=UPI0021A5F4DB|nr:hypothetical protein [Sedimenticola hydrogenitrophicus]